MYPTIVYCEKAHLKHYNYIENTIVEIYDCDHKNIVSFQNIRTRKTNELHIITIYILFGI